MVVLKNRLLFRGIFYAVFQLVGRLLGLKVYQTARIFPVFQQMNGTSSYLNDWIIPSFEAISI